MFVDTFAENCDRKLLIAGALARSIAACWRIADWPALFVKLSIAVRGESLTWMRRVG